MAKRKKILIYFAFLFTLLCNQKVYATEVDEVPHGEEIVESKESEIINEETEIIQEVSENIENENIYDESEDIAESESVIEEVESEVIESNVDNDDESITESTEDDSTHGEEDSTTDMETVEDDIMGSVEIGSEDIDSVPADSNCVNDISELTSYLSVISEDVKSMYTLLMVLCILVCSFGIYLVVFHMINTRNGGT